MNLAEMLAMADEVTRGVDVSTGEFEPIAPGKYNVIVVAAEGPVDTTRANYANPSEFGKRISLTLEVTEGKYKGRRVFMNNNILVYPKSPSADDAKSAQKAMAIGGKERKVMLDSIGKSSIATVGELVGATFSADINIDEYNGKKRNGVGMIRSLASQPQSAFAAPSAPSFAPPAQAPAPSAQANSALPWFKK